MDKKKNKGKAAQQVQEEPVEEKPKVEEKPLTLDGIFFEDKIDELFNAEDPIESAHIILQNHFQKLYGNSNFDEEKLKAEAEFHINNLVFLKQNFNFDNETISKLMNILGKLIKFRTKKEMIVPKPIPPPVEAPPEEVVGGKNVNPPPAQNEAVKEVVEEKEQKIEEEEIKDFDIEEGDENKEDVDFLALSKKKINQFKESLITEKLMPKSKNELALANKADKTRTNGKFFLNSKEINTILKYIQNEYLPFIRMWYYFQRDKRQITERRIEVIIKTVKEKVEEVKEEVKEATEEEKKPEEEKNKKEDEKNKKEEDKKKKGEEEKKVTEESKNKEEEEKKEEENAEPKVEEKEETYMDLLERLGLNDETKKVIIEKIEELHKEVDGKIEDRKKSLEEKYKEIDETVHGKKK